MTATVAWPICFLAGADPRWLAYHFHFLVWAWLITGGFAGALAVDDWLDREGEEWRRGRIMPSNDERLP
jgi:hypothetical protein